MKRRRALPALFTVAAFSLLAGFLFLNRGHLMEHYSISPAAFLQIAILTWTVLCLLGLANQVHFGSMGMAGSWTDWLRLVTVSAFTNYLPANAGLAVKGLYLKRVHGTPYRTFAVGQVALFVNMLSANGAIGLAVLALARPGLLAGVLGAVYAAMFLSGALLLLPEPVTRHLGGRWLEESFSASRTGARTLLTVALIQAGILLAAAAILKIAFDMGPAQVPLTACVGLAAAAPLSRFVALTPGALGVRELFVGGLAYLMGFTVRDAVIASTFSRLVEFAVVCTLGSLFTFSFSGKIVSTYGKDETSD